MIQRAIPVLPSLDMAITMDFFQRLGAQNTFLMPDGSYGIVTLDACELHFYPTTEKHLIEWSSCRLDVSGMEELHAKCTELGIVHPNGQLSIKPWGIREFAVLDPHGVCYTFGEKVGK